MLTDRKTHLSTVTSTGLLSSADSGTVILALDNLTEKVTQTQDNANAQVSSMRSPTSSLIYIYIYIYMVRVKNADKTWVDMEDTSSQEPAVRAAGYAGMVCAVLDQLNSSTDTFYGAIGSTSKS